MEAGVLCVQETNAWKGRNDPAGRPFKIVKVAIVWFVDKTYITNW